MRITTKAVLNIVTVILICVAIAYCFPYSILTKRYGGSMDITLPPGEKLIEVTWKDTNLWYLTRPMRPNEMPETYTFKEDSTYGILKGTVTVRESR